MWNGCSASERLHVQRAASHSRMTSNQLTLPLHQSSFCCTATLVPGLLLQLEDDERVLNELKEELKLDSLQNLEDEISDVEHGTSDIIY